MSKVVFVGRIPYDYTEEQLTDIFRSAGPVKETRLVLDKSGKSKGFAFVEYFDADAAASAVRNLDDHRVGNMRLRVNLSQEQTNTFSGKSSGRNRGGGGTNRSQDSVDASGESNGPDGELGQNSAINYIANLISDTPRDQKLRFLSDIKSLSAEHPAAVADLLAAQPQLAYSVVQTLIDVGKIDFSHAQALVADETTEPAAPPVPPPSMPVTYRAPSASKMATPETPQNYIPGPQYVNTSSHTPTPQPVDENQKPMIRQLMALSEEQVSLLPPPQRIVAEGLRAQVNSGEIIL